MGGATVRDMARCVQEPHPKERRGAGGRPFAMRPYRKKTMTVAGRAPHPRRRP